MRQPIANVEIIEPGHMVAIQDPGRFGWRRFGVPVAGALDPQLLAAANLLLGNMADAAGLEILLSGPTLAAIDGPVGIALAGTIGAQLSRTTGETVPLPAWKSFTLTPGERLRITAPRQGIGYVALSGGITTPALLGSRSTYRRAGMGRYLEAGDRLPCAPVTVRRQGPPWCDEQGPIRLLAGPQQDHFTADCLNLLCDRPYLVAPTSDRMGLRLTGAVLHHSEKGPDIPSDAVLPGALQVPGDGQPIIILADGQTTGGYAKIATVIAADLSRLGHRRAGDSVAFQMVDRAEARAALESRQARFRLWQSQLQEGQAGMIDEAALYSSNLISGAVKG